MISADECALICDFAETYHIYDYKVLPLSLAATLAAGLGDNSRIKRKINEQPTTAEVILSTAILDTLNQIAYRLSDGSGVPPESLIYKLYEEHENPSKMCMGFESYKEYEAYRAEILEKGAEWQI